MTSPKNLTPGHTPAPLESLNVQAQDIKPKALGVVNLDWTRDPPPTTITPFQSFLKNLNWSDTKLGPIQAWPRELRQAVLLAVAEVDPVIIYWGDDNVMVYNEAYIPFVGEHHPTQLGACARDIFPDFWQYFDDIITEQRYTGKAQVGQASMLLMKRHGYYEETYFNWNLIPIIGDCGQMLGAYSRPAEASSKIINTRREAYIDHLSQSVTKSDTFDELWKLAIQGIEKADKDLPLAMLYSVHQKLGVGGPPAGMISACHLEQTLGVSKSHDLAAKQIDLLQSGDGLAQAIRTACSTSETVRILAKDIGIVLDDIEWRGYEVACEEFIVLPVQSNGNIAAVLVLGLNPRLRYDLVYRRFLQTIADVLSPEIARVRLLEEVEKRAEAAKIASLEHHRSEMKFSRFAERSPVGLGLADSQGNVFYANEAWMKFTGLRQDEINIKTWLDIIFEEDIPVVQDLWQRVVIHKESGTAQVRSKQPFEKGHMKSNFRTAICFSYPDLDDDGNIITVMTLVLDISEQKWTEEQLRLRKEELEVSEVQYRNFAERSPHGAVRTDQYGNVQFANAAWHQFYNFEPGNISGVQPWLQQIDEDDHPRIMAYFDAIRDTKGVHSIEFLRRHYKQDKKDGANDQGSDLWLLATGWAERRSDDSIDHIIFWVTDITAQKTAAKILENKMEEAIRLKNQQERFIDMISHEIRNPLSAVLHCGEEIVDSMKRCLNCLDIMPSPETLHPKEAEPQNITRNEINSALDAANTIMYCVQHQKQIVDDVLTLSKLDSDLLVVSPIPVQPSELLRSALKIFEPEIRSADIQLTVDTDGSVEMLNAEWVMLDPNRFLQIVINLVTNAIKFTKPSKVRQIGIRVTAQNQEPYRSFEGVQFVPRRQSPTQKADYIADNGIDSKSDDEIYLCFSVADTGKGLTEAERTLLFHRFAQASPKTHAEYGGSGLGLFISRQITEMLGGEIGVGSGPMGGCTFAFYVRTRITKPPRRSSLGVESISQYTKTLVTPTPGTWVGAPEPAALTEKKQEKRPKAPIPAPTVQKRKVLVVEDNLINQKVLVKQLRGRGFLVDAANHGGEALEALSRSHNHEDAEKKTYYDVILCDIEMPVMNGIQCVTEIRKREKDGLLPEHVPIIGVTANVRSNQVNMAIEVGMDGVTTKPYRIDELIAHIDRVCLDTKMLKSVENTNEK